MYSDDEAPVMPRVNADRVRRRILDAAAQLTREQVVPGAPTATLPVPETAPMSIETFLALLQDRLPVWIRALETLTQRVGTGEVQDNLQPVARATIDFYSEVHCASISVFTTIDRIVRLRSVLRAHGLSPSDWIDPLAFYLDGEQRLGRVTADLDPRMTSELLLGACFLHSSTELYLGTDALPDRDKHAEQIIQGLRLS